MNESTYRIEKTEAQDQQPQFKQFKDRNPYAIKRFVNTSHIPEQTGFRVACLASNLEDAVHYAKAEARKDGIENPTIVIGF